MKSLSRPCRHGEFSKMRPLSQNWYLASHRCRSVRGLKVVLGNFGSAGTVVIARIPAELERDFRRNVNAIPTMLNAVSDGR